MVAATRRVGIKTLTGQDTAHSCIMDVIKVLRRIPPLSLAPALPLSGTVSLYNDLPHTAYIYRGYLSLLCSAGRLF